MRISDWSSDVCSSDLRMWQEMTAQKHARDGCDKGDNRDQNEQPRLHRGPASNVEGASGLDGPKGESVTEASTGDVTPLLATPSSTAPKAATAPSLKDRKSTSLNSSH